MPGEAYLFFLHGLGKGGTFTDIVIAHSIDEGAVGEILIWVLITLSFLPVDFRGLLKIKQKKTPTE